jgi:hypothetical protein
MLFVAVRESAIGPSRYLAASQYSIAIGMEADIRAAARDKPDL